MATHHHNPARTDSDNPDVRGVLLAVAYAGSILATITAATGAAFALAGFTSGLGQFVLLAGAWLVVVSASPEIAERLALRLDRVEFGQYVPRTSRAVHTAVAYLVAE